jgi:hypothetical protein
MGKAMLPIKDPSKIDLIGQRHDGGLDLGIVAEGPINNEQDVLGLIEAKVRAYLNEISDPSFREQFGVHSEAAVRILFETRFSVAQEALELLERLALEANRQGVHLEVKHYD